MLSADQLAALVKSYNPRSNSDLIIAAYNYGREKHEGQFRKSGEPYFMHPVAVAEILANLHLDDATVVTALLHDVVEDTSSSSEDIAQLFSPEIAKLVAGVTKITKIDLSYEEKQAENVRNLLIAIAEDMRVMMVKLADRLHNMQTIRAMRPEKQAEKARETMEIFAPLAGRMGMQSMREELEDLSFRVLNPEARNSIVRRFINLRSEVEPELELDERHKELTTNIVKDIELVLEKANLKAEVKGRIKKPYSIWRKMKEKDLTFSKLSDIFAFRIITDTEEDCYVALGAIHRRWAVVPTRFKDYISSPKQNGYRSIHTTVAGRDGKRVEVQIRTQEMHDIAERGVAAHWSYKDGTRVETAFELNPVKWITDLIAEFDNEPDHVAFLDAVRLEMYADKVFCFTPRGEVVKLPRGATPIDFAYAIHTRLGSRFVGAKVDGARVSAWYRLRNGQSVEIIKADGQVPQQSWLELCKTGKAKSAIRRALKRADRQKHIVMGRELLRAAFEHVDKKLTDKAVTHAASKLQIDTPDELFVRLSQSQLRARDVLKEIYPEINYETRDEIDEKRAVIGLNPDQHFDRLSCCQPLPGERIVGIAREGHAVTIHAIDCDFLMAYEDQPELWMDVQWHEGTHPAVYPVTLDIIISNDAGVLGRICTLIGTQKANISDLEFVDRKPDFYRLRVNVELRNVEQLHSLMSILEIESEVASIKRVRRPYVPKSQTP